MNGWDIPAVSRFSSDPEFSRHIQTWRGAEVQMEKKKPKRPKVKREVNRIANAYRGGRPKSVFFDAARMHAYRESGHTWKECAEKFGCSWEYARALILKLYPETTRYLRGPVTAKRTDLDTEAFKREYERTGSYRKVADHFGCCMGTVYYRLKRSAKKAAA